MRITNVPTRLFFCFLILPAAWLGFAIATRMDDDTMIPAAVVMALLSATTAYRSGRGPGEAIVYFVATAAMMWLARFLFYVSLLTYYCWGGDTEGAC